MVNASPTKFSARIYRAHQEPVTFLSWGECGTWVDSKNKLPDLENGPPRICMFSFWYQEIVNFVSPDGKRLLIIRQLIDGASTEVGLQQITIVLNWFEELKQRVPVK